MTELWLQVCTRTYFLIKYQFQRRKGSTNISRVHSTTTAKHHHAKCQSPNMTDVFREWNSSLFVGPVRSLWTTETPKWGGTEPTAPPPLGLGTACDGHRPQLCLGSSCFPKGTAFVPLSVSWTIYSTNRSCHYLYFSSSLLFLFQSFTLSLWPTEKINKSRRR